jgi:hypothetical protein
MGFEIIIDSWEAEGRLQKMIDQLQVVPVPAELTAWQREDMKRKNPITDIINPTTAETRIWPRGRTVRQLKTRQRITSQRRRAPGKHPILRPILFDMLRERGRLLLRAINW